MSTSVFVDPLRNAAVLVSDDPPFALGPLIVADTTDEALEAMMAFVQALEEAPDKISTIQLMIEWHGFLGALSGEVVALSGAAQETAPDDGSEQGAQTPEDPGPDSTGPEDAPGDPFDDDGRADQRPFVVAEPKAGPPVIGPDGDDDADEDQDDDDAAELHDRLQHIPGGTPAQRGEQECFACDGTGHPPGQPETTCNLCDGTGKIEHIEIPATTTAQEGATE